ncbi:MAG: MFS transporter, partial [Candidatus Bathyarchaeia archaeon]
IIMIFSAISLRFPPSDWTPHGRSSTRQRITEGMDLSRERAMRTVTFYALWICYIIGTLAGLMAIGISKQVGLEIAERLGLSEGEVSPLLTALLVPFALCNGFGRPLFGWLTDKLTPRKTAIISFALILTASLTTFMLQNSLQAYIFTFAVLWLNLGGWLAIAPAATASFFGTRDYARNYGLIFTAYGVGALIGNLVAGYVKDILGSYMTVFPVIAILSIMGIVIAAVFLKPPEIQEKKDEG